MNKPKNPWKIRANKEKRRKEAAERQLKYDALSLEEKMKRNPKKFQK